MRNWKDVMLADIASEVDARISIENDRDSCTSLEIKWVRLTKSANPHYRGWRFGDDELSQGVLQVLLSRN